MNSIEDLNKWVDEIKDMRISIENIDILKSFIKFSPEKMADKLGIDREILIKSFTIHKRDIHNKIIIFEKSMSLKDYEPITFGFYHNGEYVKTIKGICVEYFEAKYKLGKAFKFYPQVKYLYYDKGDGIIIFPINDTIRKIHISNDEFNNSFLSLREHRINILTNKVNP